jgi:putative lipoic acid-binding regulatory protein
MRWDNPDFIQDGSHIGRYVTVSVNTEVEKEQIKALYSSMTTTSKLIDVCIYASPL